MPEASIPVIDFSQDLPTVAQEVKNAYMSIGFMYAKNLLTEFELRDQVFAEARRFFELSQAEKERCGWTSEASNRGYTAVVKSGQLRAGAHTDYGTHTLLLQDDTEGLEVQNRDGEWVAAPSIPDTVLVNGGDLLARWTNDVFCSTPHRVVLPQDQKQNQKKLRLQFL